MTNRPNILWIMSEDFPPRTGAYGDPLANTPNLDSIADDGVLFENAFCASPVCAPSRFSIITGVYPWSMSPGQHMQAKATVPDDVRTYAELLREAGYYAINNAKTHYNSDIDEQAIWDDCSLSAHWRGRPTPDTPFFAAFMPQPTHESALFHEKIGPVSPNAVDVPAYLPDNDAVRSDIARYYSAIEKLDSEVGQLLDELRADGLYDETIIIWTSDHGGVWPRSKRFVYDEGLQIPLVVRIPEKWRALSPWAPGERVDTAVGQIDMTPTVLALAGIKAPAHMQGAALFGADVDEPAGVVFGGRDRMDERWDLMRTARDNRFRYIRNYAPDLPWGQHYAFPWLAKSWQSYEQEHLAGTLNEVQDAFWGDKPAEELYDVVADPDEVNNLIDDPVHDADAKRMRALVDEHMLAVFDNGLIPEGSFIEGWHSSRDAQAYPLRRAMDVAATAIQRDPAAIPHLVEALADDNDIIRFWGARGLVMLREKAAPARDALRAALTDPSAHVRVATAWATLYAGDRDAAVAALLAHLDARQPWQIRLLALNALTYAPTPVIEALPAVEALHDDDQQYLRGAARYLHLVLRDEYTPDAKDVFDVTTFMARLPATMRSGAASGVDSR